MIRPHPVSSLRQARKRLRPVVRFTLTLLCCWTTWAVASPADELEDHFRQAQESQRRGDYKEAAQHYREIVKLRPDLAEALSELHQALSTDPNGSHHYQLARIYRLLGDQKTSASALEKSEGLRAEARGK